MPKQAANDAVSEILQCKKMQAAWGEITDEYCRYLITRVDAAIAKAVQQTLRESFSDGVAGFRAQIVQPNGLEDWLQQTFPVYEVGEFEDYVPNYDHCEKCGCWPDCEC